MIWRVVSRYADLRGADIAMTPSDTMTDQVHALMPLTLRG